MARNKEIFMTRTPLQVQVKRLEPRTIAYLRHVGPYNGDTGLFRRLFEKLFPGPGLLGLYPRRCNT